MARTTGYEKFVISFAYNGLAIGSTFLTWQFAILSKHTLLSKVARWL